VVRGYNRRVMARPSSTLRAARAAVTALRVAGASFAFPALLALLAILAAGALGCASPGIHPGADVSLGPGEGILVVHSDSDLDISRLRVRPAREVWSQTAGSRLLVLVVPAGAYRWRDLQVEGEGDSWEFAFPADPRYSFRVLPGTINYGGSFLVVDQPDRVFMKVLNRSAAMLALLEREHAELLSLFPIAYTGHVRDDFLEHYWTTRRSGGSAAAR